MNWCLCTSEPVSVFRSTHAFFESRCRNIADAGSRRSAYLCELPWSVVWTAVLHSCSSDQKPFAPYRERRSQPAFVLPLQRGLKLNNSSANISFTIFAVIKGTFALLIASSALLIFLFCAGLNTEICADKMWR
jgi:hypothetical protein